ncbi:MAG: hypothetical protein ACRD3T_14550 [Terriglobia bacterium]
MNRVLLVRASFAAALLLLTVNAVAQPQYGTAENGYWPMGYHGDTFTGVVTAADDASRSITLTYTNPKNGKTETLTASFKKGYMARWSDGSNHQVKPSDFKIGSHLKIYYTTQEHKVNGKRVKTTSILLFKTVAGN